MADPAHKRTDKELAKIVQHLTEIYQQASEELSKKAEKYFAQFEKLDKQKRALVEDGRISEEDYKTWRKNKIMTGKHWTRMKEQAAQELLNANRTAQEYINGRVSRVYEINYNYTAKSIETLTKQAVSFELANRDAIKYVVENVDKNLLPQKKIDPAKDIPWNMRKVNSEILQGIIQGESIPKMANRLKNVGVYNRESAVRAARTIVTQTENKARYDCAKSAEEKGVIMAKEWIAANDNRTRDAHRDAGRDYGTRAKAIPLDEAFVVGGEEMMFAGDPAGSPWNVYNCRCATPHIPVGFKSILPPEKRGKIKVTFT